MAGDVTGVRHSGPSAARRAAGRALLGVAAALAVVAPTAAAVPVATPTNGGQLAGASMALAPGDAVARTDQVRDEQWQLDELRAETAWRSSTGRGVTVAVVDSGVDGNHPDLVGQVLPGKDLVGPGGGAGPDPVGHGTTVAGLIAGRKDDKRGVVGLAPDARILPVRVLDEQNRYDDALIVAQGSAGPSTTAPA